MPTPPSSSGLPIPNEAPRAGFEAPLVDDPTLINIFDYEARALELLPEMALSYYVSGSGDERSDDKQNEGHAAERLGNEQVGHAAADECPQDAVAEAEGRGNEHDRHEHDVRLDAADDDQRRESRMRDPENDGEECAGVGDGSGLRTLLDGCDRV